MHTILYAALTICAPLVVFYLWQIARHLGAIADELGHANATGDAQAPASGPNVSPMGLGGGGR